MIEVEAKVRVRDNDPRAIRSRIGELATYVHTEKKVDDYYAILRKNKFPSKVVRFRKLDGYYEINAKRRLSDDHHVYAKDEPQLRLSEIDTHLQIFHNLGFEYLMTKEKKTELYTVHKHLHIELNHVKDLGWFIEVEAMVKKPTETDRARNEIIDIIRKLGYSEDDIVTKSYAKLIWEKHHKKNAKKHR